MGNYYEMTIAGCKRQLPICKVNDNMDIAAFVIFGDVELTEKAAAELLKIVPEFDYILTPEAKGIPLGYEMSRQSGKKYFVARKGKKLYMTEPFGVEVRSITTAAVQELFLDRADADEMDGKRVLVVDDVISTGESLNAVLTLLEATGANVVGKCAILAEGDAAKREDIIFLEELPLLMK